MALVVFLRGVNVGGHRSFRPTMLAEELAHLDPVNIGAAGTFVIRHPISRTALRREVARRLPFDLGITICDGREILRLMSRDWFTRRTMEPDVVRFVSVLARAPRATPRLPLSLPPRGAWLLKVVARQERFLLGVYRRQMKVISCLGMLDGLFGVPASTRNWNTMIAVRNVLDRAVSKIETLDQPRTGSRRRARSGARVS